MRVLVTHVCASLHNARGVSSRISTHQSYPTRHHGVRCLGRQEAVLEEKYSEAACCHFLVVLLLSLVAEQASFTRNVLAPRRAAATFGGNGGQHERFVRLGYQ